MFYQITKIRSLAKLGNFPFHSSAKCKKIQLPARIHREPTDILKALAGTVGHDKTRAKYVYHDDPFLYPATMFEQKTYALSKEAGKKAARWVRDKHGELFDHQPDDPIVKEYLPKPFVDENKFKELDASESFLISLIENFNVLGAISIYELCKEKNIELSTNTLQDMLELVCFSNENEIIDKDCVTEIMIAEKDTEQKTRWKKRGIAVEIYGNLPEGSKPCCAMIRGLCKYHQSDKAWQLYEEGLQKGFSFDSETFASLIAVIPLLDDDPLRRWLLIEKLLHKMNELRLPPTIEVLNSTLNVLFRMKTWKKSRTLSMQILAEFRRCNVEPSLGTFALILKIQNPARGSPATLLNKIMDYIEDKPLTVRSVHDTEFFLTSMNMCNRHHRDWEMAKRIHKFLNSGHNHNFIGNNLERGYYFNSFFMQAMQSLPVEEFFNLYDSYVPNTYVPNQEVMMEVLQLIAMLDRVDFLPKIWEDCKTYRLGSYAPVLEIILMIINRHQLEKTADPWTSKLVDIAFDIWNAVEDTKQSPARQLEWSPEMLGDYISILARCRHHSKLVNVIKKIKFNPQICISDISMEVIRIATECAIDNKDFNTCDICVSYLKERELDYNFLINEIRDKMELTQGQQDIFSSYQNVSN